MEKHCSILKPQKVFLSESFSLLFVVWIFTNDHLRITGKNVRERNELFRLDGKKIKLLLSVSADQHHLGRMEESAVWQWIYSEMSITDKCKWKMHLHWGGGTQRMTLLHIKWFLMPSGNLTFRSHSNNMWHSMGRG